ncbi:DUF63 family protein [Halorientalis regularis]|jgi:uncharacterized membrane protein|uniref:Uncharacterized membrane protein n=1 Tax=Halorientalis regularis TaxID=660518 RepID=A0A1G7NLD0_9EURY|nr:DUF63 family protein [Halorientalis regularis]SDF74751.1 Uncharacterized membrane protein [Halorientalis regularis]
MQVTERIDAGRAWTLTALAGVAALILGSLVFYDTVYRGFVWHYFWGPVYADAHNAVAAVHRGGSVELLYNPTAREAAVAAGQVVAEPGYTLVSEVGYMVVLLFGLIGVLQLLRRLDVGRDRDLFFALVPFMLFGGALRVVEDANDAVPEGVSQAITYPWNSLIISPIIYFTVFFVTLASLLVTIKLRSGGYVETYARPMAAVGSVAFVVTFGYLVTLSFSADYVEFYPQVLLSVVLIATALAGGIYFAVDRFRPEINAGTGLIGLVVLWGHAIDGVANVVAADWLGALGLPAAIRYSPKHPANAFIISTAEAILPASLLTALGSSWPFLLVKLVVALAVVWIFDREIFEESPRYALLLLTAIVAVGLGPGTRDMIRATFGI